MSEEGHLLHTESTSYVAPPSPRSSAVSATSHLRSRYRSASSVSSTSVQRQSGEPGTGGAESTAGSSDSSAPEFHPIATRGGGGTSLRSTSQATGVLSRHVSDETSPSPQPQPPQQPSESPVVFRLRESATASSSFVATSIPAMVS